MKKWIICLSLIAFATVRADDDAEHLKLAEKALAAMDVQRSIEQSFEAAKKMQAAQISNLRLSTSDAAKAQEMQNEIMAVIREEFTWDRVKEDYVKLYADVFTDDELKGLADFYSSPIGRKFVEKMPLIMEKSTGLSQKQMLNVMPKIREITAKYLPANPPGSPLQRSPMALPEGK